MVTNMKGANKVSSLSYSYRIGMVQLLHHLLQLPVSAKIWLASLRWVWMLFEAVKPVKALQHLLSGKRGGMEVAGMGIVGRKMKLGFRNTESWCIIFEQID
jgi:hypothetical protein